MAADLPLACSAVLLVACVQPPATVPADGGVTHLIPKNAGHLSTCDGECGNEVNPPTGGPHCGQLLSCRKHAEAQPRCKWIHNLEHGHAVLAYRCPEGCPKTLATLESIWEAQPSPRRVLLTPDPMLSRRVAAVVWGWAFSGDEADEAAIATVLSHQDEEAPEPNLPCAQ